MARKSDGTGDVLSAIAEMPEGDRTIARRLHEIITSGAPDLVPRLWYKQPAYSRDGKVLCFFRGASVDGERYLSLGFNDTAKLDDGNVWPTSYAITKLTQADEKRIREIVKRAVG